MSNSWSIISDINKFILVKRIFAIVKVNNVIEDNWILIGIDKLLQKEKLKQLATSIFHQRHFFIDI